jgi:hypothetical protein
MKQRFQSTPLKVIRHGIQRRPYRVTFFVDIGGLLYVLTITNRINGKNREIQTFDMN